MTYHFSVFFQSKTTEIIKIHFERDNTPPSTEFAHNFCTGFPPWAKGVYTLYTPTAYLQVFCFFFLRAISALFNPTRRLQPSPDAAHFVNTHLPQFESAGCEVPCGRMHNALVLSLSAYDSNVLSVIVNNLHHKAPCRLYTFTHINLSHKRLG